MDFKIGDVVAMKSGGPKMTINAICVEVVWFDENQQLQRTTFRAEELEKAE